jgi:hypothetical protein
VQAKGGKGKLLICTFSLATTYGSDPYATYLLDALVSYAVSGFTPQFEIPLGRQSQMVPADVVAPATKKEQGGSPGSDFSRTIDL